MPTGRRPAPRPRFSDAGPARRLSRVRRQQRPWRISVGRSILPARSGFEGARLFSLTDTRHLARFGGYAARFVLVAAAYYVTARLSLQVALVGSVVTPIWPPTGIAVVALLSFGVGMWPAITLAALLVNVPINPSLGGAVVIAIGN